MRTLARIITACLLTLLFTQPLYADESPLDDPDNSWISIRGTVVAPTANSFILDYGEGMITVEMDD